MERMGSFRPKDPEKTASAQIHPFKGHMPQESFPDHLRSASTTRPFFKSRHVVGTGGQGECTRTVEEKTASRTLSIRRRVSLELHE